MSRRNRSLLILVPVFLTAMVLWVTFTWASPNAPAITTGSAPTVVSYQGQVNLSGSPYSGQGYFKFAIVNNAGDVSYWSNDGSNSAGGEPSVSVPITVTGGLFNVYLGDTTLSGMTEVMSADVFDQPDTFLRVWFSTTSGGSYQQLSPDTRISTVPYAFQAEKSSDADTVDGLHAYQLEGNYQNVIVVAKSGGDFTSVQPAIDSVTDAAADNPYLVWVAPGVYSETVTMKPYVHLQGAGQEATIISSTVSSTITPTIATLMLASQTSLRDISIYNRGTGEYNVALMATDGITYTQVTDVLVQSTGAGTNNEAIVIKGSGTIVLIERINALAENASFANVGFYNQDSTTLIHEGYILAHGGEHTVGIYNTGSSSNLDIESLLVTGDNSSSGSHGLINENGGRVVLKGGTYTGSGGPDAFGLWNKGTMVVSNATVLGSNASGNNIGIQNDSGGNAVLETSSVTGRSGENAYGIQNQGNNSSLEGKSITALAENASVYNFGLQNEATIEKLEGGSFTGRGGTNSFGIINYGYTATLKIQGASVFGENGSVGSHGLVNMEGGLVNLSGGDYAGRGGPDARGIWNVASALTAINVSAMGEGSNDSFGLRNDSGASAVLHGSTFIGNGGNNTASGINSRDGGTFLIMNRITATGMNASTYNYGLDFEDGTGTATANSSQFLGDSPRGLYLDGGTVRLGVCQLVGGATRVTGTLTCFQVYDGTYLGYTCP